jgi:DNA repair protein RadC
MRPLNKITPDNSSKGHFQRLRERFQQSGLSGFQDYEVIELLCNLTSHSDQKNQAKEAIKSFKTLRGVLEAPPKELQMIKGIGPVKSLTIKIVHEVARQYLKEKITELPVVESSQQVFDYLYHSMRDLKKEVFKVLLLNTRNQIIESYDMPQGTVNASYVSPREVIEYAIKHSAVSLIFAHNHPSGNPDASSNDKDLTRDMVFAASILKFRVLDHIIIGDNRYFSFAAEGLIDRYEADFLKLKMNSAFDLKPGTASNKLPWG